MGEISAIAGFLRESNRQIDPPLRVWTALAADTKPTAHGSLILPERRSRSAARLENQIAEGDCPICTVLRLPDAALPTHVRHP